jgi:excisionase family DNA binding protein
MRTTLDRFEASEEMRDKLNQLDSLLQEDGPCLFGRDGFKMELPDPIFHVLLRTVQMMMRGQTILLMPEDECVTTKAAADFLGVSRPFLVSLLNDGKIPFFEVGSHKRIKFKDLHAYKNVRDSERQTGLRRLFDKIQEEGHYEDAL